jgi:hypothetical protein
MVGGAAGRAQSMPLTYEWNGRQYIVICAGGHGKMKSKIRSPAAALGNASSPSSASVLFATAQKLPI